MSATHKSNASAALGPEQCRLCQHAFWRRSRVVGCRTLAGEQAAARTAALLQTLLFSLASERACPARDTWEAGPDAYFSQDLPEPGGGV